MFENLVNKLGEGIGKTGKILGKYKKSFIEGYEKTLGKKCEKCGKELFLVEVPGYDGEIEDMNNISYEKIKDGGICLECLEEEFGNDRRKKLRNAAASILKKIEQSLFLAVILYGDQEKVEKIVEILKKQSEDFFPTMNDALSAKFGRLNYDDEEEIKTIINTQLINGDYDFVLSEEEMLKRKN